MNIRFLDRFKIAITLLFLIIIIGTVGYTLIESWSILDSLYMTVITISTVGFSEVQQLSPNGKIFSIVLIITGVGIMLYTVTMLAEYITAGQLGLLRRHKMEDQIEQLKDHFIICGYGRVGKAAAATITEEQKPLIIIDIDEKKCLQASEDGYLCLQGDVTKDRTLKDAGIEKSRALIAALRNDAENVYVSLTARELRPDILISARASDDDSERKLRRAGANRVISPQSLGGRRMAMITMRPQVLDFIDTTVYSRKGELSLEDLFVTPESPIAGMTVQDARSYCNGINIVAMKKQDGTLIANPSPGTIVEVYDEIVAIGTRTQLRMIERDAD